MKMKLAAKLIFYVRAKPTSQLLHEFIYCTYVQNTSRKFITANIPAGEVFSKKTFGRKINKQQIGTG